MAYIQSSTNQDDDAAHNVGTNIFQNIMGGNPQGGQQPGAQQGQNGDQSQAIQSGGGPSATATQGGPTAQSSGAMGAQTAISRNKNRQSSPIDIKGMAGNIGASAKGFKNEADDFLANASNAQNWGMGDDGTLTYRPGEGGSAGAKDVLEGALGGSADAQTKVKAGMSGVGQDAEFKPQAKIDYTQDLAQAQNSGIERTFKQQGGLMATSGQAAFDSMLLNQNADFTRDRADLGQATRHLDNTVKASNEKLAKELPEGMAKARKTLANDYTAYIQQAMDDLLNPATTKAADATTQRRQQAEQYLKQLPPDVIAGLMDQAKPMIEKIAQPYSGQEASIRNQIERELSKSLQGGNFLGVDPASFMRFNTDVGAGAYLSDADIARITNANRLLGIGGSIPQRQDIAPLYSVDGNAANAAIQQMIAKIPYLIGGGVDISVPVPAPATVVPGSSSSSGSNVPDLRTNPVNPQKIIAEPVKKAASEVKKAGTNLKNTVTGKKKLF